MQRRIAKATTWQRANLKKVFKITWQKASKIGHFPFNFIKTNRNQHCLRRGEGVGRLGWGVRGSIAAAWDVSGVAMGFGSTTLALAKSNKDWAFSIQFHQNQSQPALPETWGGSG